MMVVSNICKTPKDNSLQSHSSRIKTWLLAIEPDLMVCMYENWKDEFWQLFNTANKSKLFQDSNHTISMISTALVYIVSVTGKGTRSLPDICALCGVRNLHIKDVSNYLKIFMRHCLDVEEISWRTVNCQGDDIVQFGNARIMPVTVDGNTNEEYILKGVKHTGNFIEHGVLVEIMTAIKLRTKYGIHQKISHLVNFFCTSTNTWLLFKKIAFPSESFSTSFLRRPVDVKIAFKQICVTIQQMHIINIAHRDIKMHNIMIDNDGNFIVIDFGLSSVSHSKTRQTFPVCTITTRPPEFFEKKNQKNDQEDEKNDILFDSFKTDIWSLGCILSALSEKNGNYIIQGYTEENIKVSMQNLFQKAPDNRLDEFQTNLLGDAGQDLLWKMLKNIPEERPSIEDVLSHKFFMD
jgi:serine/threonine protein kinase